MKTKIEYVWLDGYEPEPNLRSKVKIINEPIDTISEIPEWNFDGSSTKQAETNTSDCILKPVRMYKKSSLDIVYVLCEVMNSDGTPHISNQRAKLLEEDKNLWFGFEQEYFIRNGVNGIILGHDRNFLKGQGEYYCGVGQNVVGRTFVDEHTDMCLSYGIEITGTNAEVALGQWEYQVFSKGKLKSGDDLWMSRYFLFKLSEKYNYHIEFHPKPLTHGEWNGSGLHANFSNEVMRDNGGEEYFKSIFSSLNTLHQSHIKDYGSSNEMRLTGKFETQSIDKFSWGISDRGASIRVPQSTAKEWKGYLEDRRPASNADPYKVIYRIDKSLKNAKTIDEIKYVMSYDIDIEKISEKYGTKNTEELLKEYRNDE